jgi:hypothetical protein
MDTMKILQDMDACDPALEWVADRPDLAPDALWRECSRGDWLLWLAARVGIDRRLIVGAACDCAEPALKHVPDGEDRPRLAIETARAWCRGEAGLEEVRVAADDAEAAALAADYAAALSADATYADAHAADAAYSAAHAADAPYAAALAAASLAQGADLVRARIPWPTVAAALAGANNA